VNYMLKEAILKIKKEMDENDRHPYVQVVGNFLLEYLEKKPAVAEKILDDKKTIVKSLNAMKKAAEKNKVGNCAVLTDQEGFEVVLEYYDIKEIEIDEYVLASVENMSMKKPKKSAD